MPRLVAGLGIAAALVGSVLGEPIVYTNFPWGRVTILDSGEFASSVSAAIPGVGADELLFANATSLPATADVRTGSGATERVARATLTISESNISGLAVDGAARLSGSGLSLGSSARVMLSLFIQLDQGAVIRVADLVSSVPATGGLTFSLFSTDPDGTALGGPLTLTFSGEDFSYVSTTAGFFRLDMEAFASGTTPGTTTFAYRFDLDSLASVPEPATVGLAVVGLALTLGIRRIRRR